MPNSNVAVTEGSGKNIDTRTTATDGDHRQVVVIGDPDTDSNVADVQNADPGSSSTLQGLVVRLAGSATIVGLEGTTARPFVMNTEGAIKVYDLVNGTISTITRVDRVFNLIDGTITTVTGVDRVRNLVDGTISTVSRIDRVVNLSDGTLSTVVRVTNLVDGTLTTVTGVDRIRNVVDGTISTVSTVTGVDRVRNIVDGTISTVSRVDRVMNVIDGTITTLTGVDRVRNVVDGTISTVSSVVRVTNVVDGTISLANIQATAVVNAAGGSVAGSTSAVSASGLTVVSPESGRKIKVYAFSLTTTAQVGSQIRFTNGAGTSPTVLWQVALQAPTQGIAGANLSVTPPGYLFAAGSGETLALVKDTGSLLHYAISYFKESA